MSTPNELALAPTHCIVVYGTRSDTTLRAFTTAGEAHAIADKLRQNGLDARVERVDHDERGQRTTTR